MKLSNKFCTQPWDFFECGSGYVKACCWTPRYAYRAGKPGPGRLWNLPPLAEIRRSIMDGSFKYCDKKTCIQLSRGSLISRRAPAARRIIAGGLAELPGPPGHIHFSNDMSCNLSCPQCRAGKFRLAPGGKEYAANKKIFEDMIKATIGTSGELVYSFCGAGEPFASGIYREFLLGADLRKKPNIKIALHTNGLLLTPRCFAALRRIHQNLLYIAVSIDAATEKTYGLVRPGGNWRLLMKNLAHLAARKRAGAIHAMLRLDFVVQKANYREMAAAAKLARGLGCGIFFQPIREVYKSPYFAGQQLWKKKHPLHADFLKELGRPELSCPGVELASSLLSPQAGKAVR